MRAFKVPLCILALALAATTPATGQQNSNQDPNQNPPPANQQPPKPGEQPAPGPAVVGFEALIDREAIDAAFGRKAVATAGMTWQCEPPRGKDPVRCTGTGSPQMLSVSTCRQLAGRVGPVTAFRGGGKVLGATELKRCNAGLAGLLLPAMPSEPGQPGGGFVPANPTPIMDDDLPPMTVVDAIQIPATDGPLLDIPELPELDLRCDGPDPAVVGLTIWIAPSRRDPAKVTAMLNQSGSVANVGRAEWVSERLQQIAYRVAGRGGAPSEILGGGDFDFPRLAPGESRTDGLGGWIGRTDADFYPGETSDEFADEPPGIGIRIVYDPDIFIDGNPQNDDCNLGNNEMFVTGAQIAEWARDGREVIEVTRGGSVTFRDRES